MKIACKQGDATKLHKRRKTKASFPDLFSTYQRRKPDRSSNLDDDDGIDEDQDIPSSERNAMIAVSQVCQTSVELKFPWPQIPSLFDEEQISYFQQQSPFYFRGQVGSSLAFFKVWRLGDEHVVKSFIRQEARLLKCALAARVLVPSVLSQAYTSVDGSRYFVLALEEFGSAHKMTSYENWCPIQYLCCKASSSYTPLREFSIVT